MKILKYILILLVIFVITFVSILIYAQLADIKKAVIVLSPNQELMDVFNSKFKTFYLVISLLITLSVLSYIILVYKDLIKLFKIKKYNIQETLNKLEQEETENKVINTTENQEEINIANQEKEIKLIESIEKLFSSNRFTDKNDASEKFLITLSKTYEIVQGELFVRSIENNNYTDKLILSSTYAYYIPEIQKLEFEIGEGLIGQVAKGKHLLNLDNVPNGYIMVASGLGHTTPNNLIIIPLIYKNELIGVIEVAAFKKFSIFDENLLTKACNFIAKFIGDYDNIINDEKIENNTNS